MKFISKHIIIFVNSNDTEQLYEWSNYMNGEELIGPRIRELRKSKNITQKDIFLQTGLSSGNLSSIENGKILPSAPSLMSLSKVLGCTTDYLLFGISTSSDDNIYIALSHEEKDLIDSYRNLSESAQEEIRFLSYFKAYRHFPSNLHQK